MPAYQGSKGRFIVVFDELPQELPIGQPSIVLNEQASPNSLNCLAYRTRRHVTFLEGRRCRLSYTSRSWSVPYTFLRNRGKLGPDPQGLRADAGTRLAARKGFYSIRGMGGRMPRQNRVTPFGEIIAAPERGTMMGNRGLLHDPQGHIKRSWQVKRWLLCVLAFKGRKRQVMKPGYYTELFFLDEATGLAAGHRPCAECRRNHFLAFRNAWPGGSLPAPALDDQLHTERLNPDGSKRVFEANLDDLPDGVFVTISGIAYLLWKGLLLAWSPGGYQERLPRPKGERVTVLTPRSTVDVIRAGYVPEVHVSAEGS